MELGGEKPPERTSEVSPLLPHLLDLELGGRGGNPNLDPSRDLTKYPIRKLVARGTGEAGSPILRAGGKRRFDPETLGVGGRKRELQWGLAPRSPTVCPWAPPCWPCICGSERGAGYCLKELAEFPVVLVGEGKLGRPRMRAFGAGDGSGPTLELGYASSLLFSPTPWQGGVGGEEQQMECGSCGFALHGE